MSEADATPVYSYHHFLFPFRWDILEKGLGPKEKKEEKYSFEDRTNLEKATAIFGEGNWIRKSVNKIETPGLYNELIYYHEFVRRAIYDFEDDYDSPIVRYFQYNLQNLENREYNICYWRRKKHPVDDREPFSRVNYERNTISLSVLGITLHIYNTGIGVLSFNLANKEINQNDPNTVLLINELGRRIYPQFLGPEGTWDTKRVFLADSISVGGVKENFSKYDDLSDFTFTQPLFLPSFIRNLFSEKIIFENDKISLNALNVLYTPVLDDRMFFLSWYGNNTFSEVVGKNYTRNTWWYSFIFGDAAAGGSIANSELMERKLKNHTYNRWSGYCSLYGMSRDSFVCLSPDAQFFESKKLPRLDVHMNSIYYQMAVLSLAQRASVVKFSAEIAGLTDMARVRENSKTLDRIKDLYMNYIEFINKIYFREITSQVQGIEIYSQFHEVMRIAEDVKDLDREIQELHNYADMVKQYEIAKRSEKLNQIGLPLLIASLLVGLLSINFIEEGNIDLWFFKIHLVFWQALVIILFIPVLLYVIITFIPKRGKKNKIG